MRKVRVLINPNAGISLSFSNIQQVLGAYWDVDGHNLTYQVSQSAKDGSAKTRMAVEEGVDTILVVGGDGMINTVGRELVGSDVELGVIPAGSGNGFARHFNIPLDWKEAARKLLETAPRRIDVGKAGGHPFFVTCSLAWDAMLVRTFEKFPFRGVLPYVLAAAYEYIEYEPPGIRVVLDGHEEHVFPNPLVFTIANMTQYGGGARIAPKAQPDDGLLELVAIPHVHVSKLMANVSRLFDGTIDRMPGLETYRFSRMKVERDREVPMQIDGELTEAPADIDIDILPRALNVLVPR